jgi:glutaredoxin
MAPLARSFDDPRARACARSALAFTALALAALSSGCSDPGAPGLHDLVVKVLPATGDAETGGEQAAARGVEIVDGSATMRMYYQFVDESGMVRFVERLADVPEQWRERVGFVEMAAAPPLSPMDAQRTRSQRYAGRTRPGVAKASFSMDGLVPDRPAREILVYYADWCGACKRMKRHLDRKGVDYELRDIDVPAILEELVEKTGARAIPVIDVEGRILRGYNADRLDDLLSETT